MISAIALTALLFTCLAPCGYAEDKLEPSQIPSLISSIRINTPLDFCGEPVPIENQAVLERLEKEMLISLADRVQVILWLKRSNRYMPIIEESLKQNNMPLDLKYIAIIESALRPHAGSPKGAVGFWQFIKPTAQAYGLSVNSYMDERRNIFKSTKASIKYFKALYAEFNSWTLSAAGYNMGEEGLKSEIVLQKTLDYYHLYIPLETQRYIFRAISAKLIMSDPEKYGFHLSDTDLYPPLKFDRVKFECTQKIPVYLVAHASGTFFKTIKDLNPDIRGHHFARGYHSILVPEGSGVNFHSRYESAFKNWAGTGNRQIYIVKAGDNLTIIAERFNVPLNTLLIWNNLNPNHHIHPGDRLIVFKE